MQLPFIYLTTALLLLLLPAKASLPQQQFDAYWYQGAELNYYELQQARYGEQHPGHAVLIFVTEPFLKEKQVKHEFGVHADSVPILKLNHVRKFPTGIYDYSVMTSVFTPIDWEAAPRALKATTSVQEWCGHTFTQMNRRAAHWELSLYSYFQKEGDVAMELPLAWIEDEIWTLIRMQPKALPQGDFDMIPGHIYQRFSHQLFRAESAKAKLSERRHNGQVYSVYSLEYPEIGRRLEIWFESKFPYIIEKWTESHRDTKGGSIQTNAERRKTMISDYWNKNGKEDSRLRKALGPY